MWEKETELYEKYLPFVVKQEEAFQKLAQVEGTVLEEERLAKEALEQDQWIQTATKQGLAKRAKFMGLPVDENEDLEQTRRRILFQWNKHRPFTFATLIEWLNGLCGNENYTAKMFYGEYRLSILLKLRRKNLQKEIADTLRKMIPANLLIEVLLNYNKYGQFKTKTYGAWKATGYTYNEMQTEELSL